MSHDIDQINRTTMRTVVDEYLWSTELELHERAALEAVAPGPVARRTLDIGVGAGRTVRGLLKMSRTYVGVDYVPAMVEKCRALYPGIRFEVADARSMPQFADGSFDLVVFACNGLCMVDHAGRLAILKEVHRVLAAGGVFVFSTANLNSPERARVLSLPRFRWSPHPARLTMRTIRFVSDAAISVFNRIRYRRFEIRTPEYMIRNDKNHRYSTFIYSLTLSEQRKQLVDAGFTPPPQVFDLSGKLVPDDSTDGTLTFVVAK